MLACHTFQKEVPEIFDTASTDALRTKAAVPSMAHN
jgi:hypothetical protein